VIILLSTTRIPLPWLYRQLWPSGIWPFGVGAAITVAGLLFAVWARQHLASNWSSSVTIKQGHELITTGPYALVRQVMFLLTKGLYDVQDGFLWFNHLHGAG